MTYTIADLKILVSILEDFFVNVHGVQTLWSKSLEETVKIKKSEFYKVRKFLKNVLFNCFGMHPESPRFKTAQNFILKESLDMMPLYISSEESWERLLSRWRLFINK